MQARVFASETCCWVNVGVVERGGGDGDGRNHPTTAKPDEEPQVPARGTLASVRVHAVVMAKQKVQAPRQETPLTRLDTHSYRVRQEAQLADFPTWSDGIAVHRTRYSPLRCFPALSGDRPIRNSSLRRCWNSTPIAQIGSDSTPDTGRLTGRARTTRPCVCRCGKPAAALTDSRLVCPCNRVAHKVM